MLSDRINTKAERNKQDKKEQDKKQQEVSQISSTDDAVLWQIRLV